MVTDPASSPRLMGEHNSNAVSDDRMGTEAHQPRRVAERSLSIVFWCGVVLVAIWGCGRSADDSPRQTDQRISGDGAAEVASATPPVAAIGTRPEKAEARTSESSVNAELLQAQLIEITKLFAANDALVNEQESPVTNGVAHDRASPGDTHPGDAYRNRLERIIELATEVIRVTHENPHQEQYFNSAVHYLADARLKLALSGDEIQGQLLVEDAESLFARSADSVAAAEAGFKVVELAQCMAESLGPGDAEWFTGYANQVVKFSTRFPDQGGRAALSLFTAGRMCDRTGQSESALRCFRLLREQHADSVFAEQSSGFLRRLTLAGQPLELAGPTIDGGFVEIEQYAGRIVLVVFWASTSAEFRDQISLLQRLEAQYASRGLAILGINLDSDEAVVDRFLATYGIAWPQVFSSDPNQRGGRNPVARYYSIQRVPVYWLIDQTGTVISAPIVASDLFQAVERLINIR